MAGHTGEANEAGAYAKAGLSAVQTGNGFIPEPPKKHVDVIYLCSPNNPTGAAATREQLEAWVEYALENKSVILFDAAYEAYITDGHSAFDLRNSRRARRRCRPASRICARRWRRRPAAASNNERTVLFVDEIHRFNKAQQDALLPHVEAGTITLIGATTENPSFEVNAALLSRCKVVRLEALGEARSARR